MSVVFGLSPLLTVRRSSSVYRSFSALAALIQFSHSYAHLSSCSDVYASFAADGCIFQLESLARSLGDTCVEKEYLIALANLGRAASIAKTSPWKRYDDEVRAELLDAIHLQQYVPSTPKQSYLLPFHQSAQWHIDRFRWKSVHRLRKSIRFSPLAPSLSFLLHH